MERVTAETHKDLKKVEAGHAGATARKAKQEQLLEELWVVKESLQMSEATSSTEPERSEVRTMLYKRRIHELDPMDLGSILSCGCIPVSAFFSTAASGRCATKETNCFKDPRSCCEKTIKH